VAQRMRSILLLPIGVNDLGAALNSLQRASPNAATRDRTAPAGEFEVEFALCGAAGELLLPQHIDDDERERDFAMPFLLLGRPTVPHRSARRRTVSVRRPKSISSQHRPRHSDARSPQKTRTINAARQTAAAAATIACASCFDGTSTPICTGGRSLPLSCTRTGSATLCMTRPRRCASVRMPFSRANTTHARRRVRRAKSWSRNSSIIGVVNRDSFRLPSNGTICWRACSS
jgi:hypothetical protein